MKQLLKAMPFVMVVCLGIWLIPNWGNGFEKSFVSEKIIEVDWTGGMIPPEKSLKKVWKEVTVLDRYIMDNRKYGDYGINKYFEVICIRGNEVLCLFEEEGSGCAMLPILNKDGTPRMCE